MAAADSELGDVGDDVAGSFLLCLPPLLGAESTNRLRGVLTRPATERNVGDTGLVAVDDVDSGERGAGAGADTGADVGTDAAACASSACSDACTGACTDDASLAVVPVLLLLSPSGLSSLLLLVLLLLLSAMPLPSAGACAGAASASAPASAASAAAPGMANKREEGKASKGNATSY